MTAVTIPPWMGGSGIAYTDDGSGAHDMTNGGYAQWFFPMIGEVISAVDAAVDQADAAAASAVDAANYAGTLVGTSATSIAVSTGSKSITASTGKGWVVGQRVELWRTSDTATRLGALVTAYTKATGAMTLDVDAATGSGTYNDWTIGIGGARGASGSVSSLPFTNQTAGFSLSAGDKGSVIYCTGTFTIGSASAATLGSGWWCWIDNAGAGVVTVAPTGTIDGVSSLVMREKSIALVRCDGTELKTVIAAPRRMLRVPILSADAASAASVGALESLPNSLTSTGLSSAVSRVAFGASSFVASANGANVASSPDALTWTLRAMPSSANWQVSSDGSQFVATVPGSTAVAKSTAGTSWASGTALPGLAWTDGGVPVFLGSVCVVLSGTSFGSLYRSADYGASWSTQAMPANPGGAPLSVGGLLWYWASGTTAYTSATGLAGSWTARTLPIACTGANVWQDWDGSLVLVNATGSAYYRSTDGINWTLQSFASPVPGTASRLLSINGVWLAVSATLGSCATLHSGLWAIRRAPSDMSASLTVTGARNSGASIFVGAPGSSGGEILRFAPGDASAALSLFTR